MRWNARYTRFFIAAAVVIALAVFLFLFTAALLPFIISGIFAYIIFPMVKLIDDHNPLGERWPSLSRMISVLAIYAVVLGILIGLVVFVGPTASRQATRFFSSLPALYLNASNVINVWAQQYTGSVPPELSSQFDNLLQDASTILINAGRNVVIRAINVASRALTILIGLAAVPLLLYYFLKDREMLVEGFISLFPLASQHHVRNSLGEANGVIGSYIRAQLVLGVIVGVMVYLGLLIIGVRFPVLLGIAAGLFELVPIIGPILGAIPGILVVLATSPGDLGWVILLYFGVQLLENSLLVPRIQGQALGLHPVVIILVLIMGSELAGFWGVVLGPPVAAAIVRVFQYFRQQENSTVDTGPRIDI